MASAVASWGDFPFGLGERGARYHIDEREGWMPGQGRDQDEEGRMDAR